LELKQKGESIIIKQKNDVNKNYKATLKWTSAVDLDLHCFYRLKDDPNVGKGFFGKLLSTSQEGHISFSTKGSETKAPWIRLDEDSGVGDTGGDNEENMFFSNIDEIESAIIAANIFAKDTNFSQYNGKVIVQGGNSIFEVPLTETQKGSWCVVALIDNRNENTMLKNINITLKNKPTLKDYI